MPKAKAKNSKKVERAIPSEIVTPKPSSNGYKDYLPSKRISLVLVILGLAALVYLNKNLFIAGTVNGKPVLASELNKRLNDTYRSQVLNQIINEKIIEQEAKNKGVNISQTDVDNKVKELENQYGGTDTFNSLLTQQGITRDQFIKQTKLQLTVEALYKDQINPTEEEVKKFMDENSSLPEATDAAKFKQTAIQQLKQQKLSEVFSRKFQELRSVANIQIF